MIQISQTSMPASSFTPDEGADTNATALPPDFSPFQAGADPLAKLSAANGMHAGVQQFAYASPNGGGGNSGASQTQASTPAAPTASDVKAQKEAQALMDQGVKYLNAGKYRQAIAAFDEGFRIYPAPQFILNKAAAYLESGHYAEAKLEYDLYLSDPNAGRTADATAARDRAIEKLGGREATATGIEQARRLFEQGQKAMQDGRYEDALAAFDAAYEKNPIPDFRYDSAVCQEKLGRPYAAIVSYREYLDTAPRGTDPTAVTKHMQALRTQADASPITATGAAGGQEWLTRGVNLLKEGRYDEAQAAFREGFRTYPSDKFILNEAAAYMDAGRYAMADLTYQRYLANPDVPRADEARAAQERARAHTGGREASYSDIDASGKAFERGTELYKAGRYAEALDAFKKANDLNPNPEFLYNQAACLEKMGHREAASRLYNEYANDLPMAADAGKTKVHAEKLHNEALKYAQQAFDRGEVAYKEGRFGDAAVAFGEAYDQMPFPQFLYNRGASLEKAGETKQAIREYQRYLNEQPDAQDADRVSAHIEHLQAQVGDGLMKP